jgi:hypothetical protein
MISILYEWVKLRECLESLLAAYNVADTAYARHNVDKYSCILTPSPGDDPSLFSLIAGIPVWDGEASLVGGST